MDLIVTEQPDMRRILLGHISPRIVESKVKVYEILVSSDKGSSKLKKHCLARFNTEKMSSNDPY